MLLVDTALESAIEEALAFPGVQGFTTNPTLIARAAGVETLTRDAYILAARKLCALAARRPEVRHCMIQAVGDADATLSQAETYAGDLPPTAEKKLWIKLAPTRAGLGCCRRLEALGCASLATAVFTPAQAYVAMEAGADGVAVYLGRLMRTQENWREQLQQIAEILRDAQRLLLLASFQTPDTIDAGLGFSRNLTVPPTLLRELLHAAQSEEAMRAFETRVLA